MSHAVIVDFCRSPFTPAYKGAFAETRPDDLLAAVLRAILKRNTFPAERLDDVIVGCAFPEGEQGLNIARLATFIAELPITIAGQTVNRFCGSSMQSIHIAAAQIMAGMGEAYLCAGIESMSRVPMVGFNPMPNPDLFARYPEAYEAMGITAENLAKKYRIPRKAQEEFAVKSHQKASAAAKEGSFSREIIPVEVKGVAIAEDGCIRPNTTLETLAALEPAFDRAGSVTAGTSSPLTDGASAVLVCSEHFAQEYGLPVLARIKSFAVAGCAPEIMGIGPVPAVQKALKRAGLSVSDMEVIELNEAFSAQSLAVIEELKLDLARVNLHGGAIALGHPLGASGARITGKAAQLLHAKKARYALATMCIGGGQGIATILERAA